MYKKLNKLNYIHTCTELVGSNGTGLCSDEQDQSHVCPGDC